MKLGRSHSSHATDLRSFLGEGTEITGEIKFTEIMRVDASISGSIYSESGSLLVMEKGHIKADVDAGIVEIGGTIEGKVTARTSVKILPTGRVYGDIYTPALIIEFGAVFEGKCSMVTGRKAEEAARVEPINLKIAESIR